MNKVLEREQQQVNQNSMPNYNVGANPYAVNSFAPQFVSPNYASEQYLNMQGSQNANAMQDVQYMQNANGYAVGQNAFVQNGQNNAFMQNGMFAPTVADYGQMNQYAGQNAGFAAYEQAIPQAQNYNYGYTQNGQQQLYTQQQNSASMNAYAPSNSGYGVEHKATVGKKEKINIRAKLMIGVYFLIVAVVVTLLLINVFSATSAIAAETPTEQVSITTEAFDTNGKAMQLSELPPAINYEYESQTNWFDKMCDGITKIFG